MDGDERKVIIIKKKKILSRVVKLTKYIFYVYIRVEYTFACVWKKAIYFFFWKKKLGAVRICDAKPRHTQTSLIYCYNLSSLYHNNQNEIYLYHWPCTLNYTIIIFMYIYVFCKRLVCALRVCAYLLSYMEAFMCIWKHTHADIGSICVSIYSRYLFWTLFWI